MSRKQAECQQMETELSRKQALLAAVLEELERYRKAEKRTEI